MAERYVSPGVFTRETDLSFLPQEIAAIGGAVIGPTLYGPAFRPTTISNYSEFIRTFGNTFVSGSGAAAAEYKFLTNYVAQEYLRYGDTLTVVRIVNSDATIAYSNVVSSGSYADAGNPTGNDLTSSIFNADSASFKLHLLSEGVYGNSGTEYASTNGIGTPTDLQSNGLLANESGSRVNYRWEVSDVNLRRGTFDLSIRRGDDRHGRKVILEQFNDLSLDPNDPNYIARVIGDQKYTLRGSGTGAPYLQLSGSYPNRSRIVRVEVLKNTLEYLDSSGAVRDGSLSGSLPTACSGTFAYGSDGYVQHPRKFFESIVQENTQGFNLAAGAAGISGSTAYYDAIDILSNADEYDINALFLPGVVEQAGGLHSEIITYAISMCEARGDVFLVIDPTKYGDGISLAQQSGEGRTTNYAAMYYPWIQVTDPDLNRNVWIPPSCVVAGALSFNDYIGQPWFAPAGLNRGGIEIAVQAEHKLTKANRDDLYTRSINPIATYPRDGVVIWGQKTLQKKRSALDRVSVRRMMIAVKKFIASSSRYLIFEQNTEETRDRFLGIVNPYLRDIQYKQGLYDFKVIMDESNNTPDVIDRNELRGAIHLKPTRTAEYIIIDFFLHPTGATFPGDEENNTNELL